MAREQMTLPERVAFKIGQLRNVPFARGRIALLEELQAELGRLETENRKLRNEARKAQDRSAATTQRLVQIVTNAQDIVRVGREARDIEIGR